MSTNEHTGLKKTDMKVHTVVFMIFCLVAAGAFGIEDMLPEAGPGMTVLLLCVLPFIWALPMGLVASELGSAYPQEGGYYKWVQQALGEFWGFQAGWWRTISIYVDNTLYVVLAGAYLSKVFPELASTVYFKFGFIEMTPILLFKWTVIIAFVYINIRGIKDVGTVSTILSLIVMAGFAAVAIVGFAHWDASNFGPFIPEGQGVLESIGYGIAIGMWMYSGYESMSTVAGELKDPQVIPKATMLTIPLIMAAYILPTVASLGAVGQWENWGTDSGISYHTVFEVLPGALSTAAIYGFILIAVLAQFSIFNTYIASGSRGFFALAEDHLAPPILVKCDKKRGVPYVAVLTIGLFSLILSNFEFKVILTVDVFLLMSAYVLILISAVVLRAKHGDDPRPFKIPLGLKGLGVLCTIPMLVAFVAFFINGTDFFIGGMLGITSGPIIYFIWKRMYGGLAKKDATQYPINPKTKLGVGDLYRIGAAFALLTIFGILGSLFLPVYEASWGPEYYTEEYGVANLFNIMLDYILYATIAFGVLTLIIGVLAFVLEPKKEKIK